MVAGGLPTVQVYLDDGSGTFPYELTNMGGKSYARIGYQVSRGRQDELSQVTAGQLQNLLLDNTDGRFTPGSTIIATPSPIKADAQIRVKVTANGTTVNRFTGYVQAWPVGWPTGGDTLSEVTLTATDAQARGERRILQAIAAEEILEDDPIGLWSLSDPAGASVALDSSGNQQPALVQFDPWASGGTGVPVVFGTAPGPATDGLTAVQLAPKGLGLIYQPGTPVVVNGVMFAFTAASLATITTNLCSVGTTFSGNGFGQFYVDGAGRLHFETMPAGFDVSSAKRVDDGAVHVAEVQYNGGSSWTLYLDGAPEGSVTSPAPTPITMAILQNQNLAAGVVTMAYFAMFTSAPGSARAFGHAYAMLTGFSGEDGSVRVNRLAAYGNIPVGALDSPTSAVAFKDFTGSALASALQEVADAEMGLVFIDGSGNLILHNRNRVPSKVAPDVTVDANFLDEGTAFTTDMQGVVNYFEATAAGTSSGARVIVDTASETSHGRYSQSQTYLVQTDAEALDRANWIVATHKEPGPRVGTLALDLLTMTAAQQAQMLAIEPDTWIRVTGLPTQTPGGTTADLIVQGWSDTLGPDGWTLTLNVVDKNTVYPSVWLLGDPTFGVLDSTTRLYV